jgi:glycerophosphoryl diester phosphodiesterase
MFPTVLMSFCLFFTISCEEEEVLDLSESNKEVKCIAHRGYVTDNIFENSLEALETAYSLGADGVEFDVIQTKDGTAILNHDPTMNSEFTKDKGGKKCDFETLVRDQNGKDILANCQFKNGASILTLEDVLKHFHKRTGFTLLLDLKNVMADNTLETIKKYYADRPTDIIAEVSYGHDVSTLFRIKSKLSPIPVYVLNNIYVSGAELHYDGIETYKISKYHIDRLRASGVSIIVYNLKGREEYRNAMSLGVDALDIDDIKLCLDVKRQRFEENQ